MTHAQVTAARLASPEWQRDPIWTSPTLRRMSAEAVWDRKTYEATLAEWKFEHGLNEAAAALRIPSRARRRHARGPSVAR